ncbi:hypothetical protein N7476_008532 [Penicillium atrosanguineum]|uniref:Uncharacterized protein n=1 Tax=Penicillium atrosanguineum TaxID=1132637 RepID=A0A9W9PS23_9EURO|nr:hypothetical protein N7476_008532 [Penicillium atrosanguineum]
MHAAAQMLKGMGIEGLVEQFELSELAAHISAALRTMTGGKTKEGNVDFSTFCHPGMSSAPASSQEDSPSRGPQHESTSSPSGNGWPFSYNSFNGGTAF